MVYRYICTRDLIVAFPSSGDWRRRDNIQCISEKKKKKIKKSPKLPLVVVVTAPEELTVTEAPLVVLVVALEEELSDGKRSGMVKP